MNGRRQPTGTLFLSPCSKVLPVETKENDYMKIYREVFSPIQVNTYIVEGDNGGCIIIDCGCYGTAEEKRLEDLLVARGLKPELLINTHCHLDHIFGNRFMLERYGLRTWFHEGDSYNHTTAPKHALMFGLVMDAPPEPAGYLVDGDVVSAAGLFNWPLFVIPSYVSSASPTITPK